MRQQVRKEGGVEGGGHLVEGETQCNHRDLGRIWGQKFSDGFVWTVRNPDRFGGGGEG